MHKFLIPFVALGFVLSLTACQGGPPLPTATAVPLAATATLSPRPPRPPRPTSTSTANSTASQPATAVATPTAAVSAGPASLSELDDRLAKRAAEGFVARLAAGRVASASSLYLTDRARQGEPGQLLSELAGGTSALTDAALLELRRATGSSYEARALLRWTASDERGPASQTMTLRLAYQRGLWLIDDLTLGDLLVATPTPARRPGTARPTSKFEGKLVFQVSSGGDLYTINADGSALRRLTDGLDPAWSPDGQQIAFSRWRNPWGIYLIRPDGAGPSGDERRVVDAIQLKEVAWSPDGSRLAFTINYGSSEPMEICFFGFCFTLPPFSFGQLWTADLDSGELLSLPLDDKAVHAPTWSPDGGRIVYAGDRGLAWIDLDDMGKGRFEGGSVWDTSPSYSPSGEQIAFMSRVHDHWEVFVVNADGSGRRQLTVGNARLETPPSSVAPAWSPDGQYIAFLSNRDGPWRIYVVHADGSGQRPMFGSQLDSLGIRYEWASERVLSWTR